VLVCARDASEGAKQESAQRWLGYLWRSRTGRLSYQVLDEYYLVVTEKLKPGLDREQARADVRNLKMDSSPHNIRDDRACVGDPGPPPSLLVGLLDSRGRPDRRLHVAAL
jgi:hypothetical protein